MPLKKLSKSYGTSYAGLTASLRDMSGQPARYYGLPDGILPVPNGQITLNSLGGFGVYVDDSKLYQVVIYGSTPGVVMLTDLNIEVDSASASNGLTAAQVEAGATSVVGVTNSGTLVNGVGTPVSGGGTYTVVADPGVDCHAAVTTGLAYLKTLGGGTLRLPKIGGVGYVTSGMFYVDFSNCLIVLEDTLSLIATSPLPLGPYNTAAVVQFQGTTQAYLDNVGLIGVGRVKIDANGRNLVGYTHTVGGAAQHGVVFQMCRNIYAENIYVYNGPSGGITTYFCLGGKLVDCSASHSVYDNGIYHHANGEHVVAFSEDNPASWANLEVVRARAWNCPNHGLGIFGAVGVTYTDPKIWGCGNNTGTALAGPAGGLGIEYDLTNDPNMTRNYRFTAINVQVTGSYGFGIRTNCKGTKILGGYVRGTKIPTAYTDAAEPVWGSAIFIQANADAYVDCDVDGSERYGIRLQGAPGKFPSLRFDGIVQGCVNKAIYGIGFNLIQISPNSVIRNNGTVAGGAITVDLTNQVLNANAGMAAVGGRFDENGGTVMQAGWVGAVDIRGIAGHNNCNLLASAYHAIYLTSVPAIYARDILLTDSNAKQARVLKIDGGTKVVVDRASILGDQTNASAPRVDISSASVVLGDIIATVAPAVAPNYINQRYLDTALGKYYVAKGQASVADWVALN